MRRPLLITILAMPGMAYATDYVGTNFNGGRISSWRMVTPSPGNSPNVGRFEIPADMTVTVPLGDTVQVFAQVVQIDGILDANGLRRARRGRPGRRNQRSRGRWQRSRWRPRQ